MERKTTLRTTFLWMDRLYYLLLALSFFYAIISSTVLYDLIYSEFFFFISNLLFLLIPLLAGIRVIIYILEYANINKGCYPPFDKKISYLVFNFFSLAFLEIYLLNNGERGDILYFTLFGIVGSIGLSFKKIAKIWFWIECLCAAVLFILALTGLIYNNKGNAWGYIYRTDYACILLFIFLLYCFYHKGNFSKTGWIFLGLMFLFNLLWVRGKASLICMFLALIFSLIYNYKNHFSFLKKFKKICSNLFLFSFFIYAAIMFFLSLAYYNLPRNLLSKIPGMETVLSRFMLSNAALDLFPVTLFGNLINSRGSGGSENTSIFYFFLDSSYIKILLEYGLLLFIFILVIMTFIQYRLKRTNNFYGMAIIFLVASDCFIEHHMLDIAYNIFLLLAFSDLDIAGNKETNSSKNDTLVSILPLLFVKPVRVLKQKAKLFVSGRAYRKILSLALSLILIIFLNLCIYSGKEITRFSFTTPSYNATVVLPLYLLSGIASNELKQNEEDAALVYLTETKDTYCIICGTANNFTLSQNVKEDLISQGIDSYKIYIIENAASIDEVITLSRKEIDQNALPEPMVICAPDIMQREISMIAQDNEELVSGLSCKQPALTYIPTYIKEQLNVLCRCFKEMTK